MVSPAELNATRQSDAASVGTIDINNLGGDSLQPMFAKLQLALAESAKSNVMEYIEDIRETQEEQKLVANMLQQARQLQADAKASGKCTTMPPEMRKYFDDNKLARDTTSSKNDADEQHWVGSLGTPPEPETDALNAQIVQAARFNNAETATQAPAQIAIVPNLMISQASGLLAQSAASYFDGVSKLALASKSVLLKQMTENIAKS
jgi:hypothetical protein